MLDCNSKRPVLLSVWSKSRAPGWGRAFRWRSSLTHRGYLFCGGGLICGHVWKQICSVWPALAGGKSMRWLGERIEFLIKTAACKKQKNNRHWILISAQEDSQNSFNWHHSLITAQTDLSRGVHGCERFLDVNSWNEKWAESVSALAVTG